MVKTPVGLGGHKSQVPCYEKAQVVSFPYTSPIYLKASARNAMLYPATSFARIWSCGLCWIAYADLPEHDKSSNRCHYGWLNRSYFGSQFGTHFLTSNIRMLENQVLAPWILEVLERAKRGSKPIHCTISRLFPVISIAYHISRYGQLSKPYPQPCLNPVPRTVDHGPGLLEHFPTSE